MVTIVKQIVTIQYGEFAVMYGNLGNDCSLVQIGYRRKINFGTGKYSYLPFQL
jgi:hypothetical protein